jgi:hypothetical protein
MHTPKGAKHTGSPASATAGGTRLNPAATTTTPTSSQHQLPTSYPPAGMHSSAHRLNCPINTSVTTGYTCAQYVRIS